MPIFLKRNWIIFFLLSILIFFLYLNSLNNVFISDDIFGIVDNQVWGDIKSLAAYPLSIFRNIFYFLAVKLGGYNPAYFRIFNILFHIGSTGLVFYLTNRLYGRLVAIFASTLFAVHPILVESVAWISGGGYVEHGFFFFFCFITYLLGETNRRYYFISIAGFYILLTLSPIAVAFPLVLSVYEVSRGSFLKNWRKTAPFFIFAALFFVFTLTGPFQNKLENIVTSAYQEKGVDNPFILIPIAVVNYISLIVFPKDLTLYHTELSFTPIDYWLIVLAFLSFLGLIVVSYKKNKSAFFWLSFFLLSLSPTLTPFRITWAVAERYAYTASLGLIMPFALLLKNLYLKDKTRLISKVIFIIVVVALSSRTLLRIFDWKTEESFWKATAAASPSSYYAHNNLGDVYGKLGDRAASEEEFKIAILLNPNYAPAYHNLGNVYKLTGNQDLALKFYQKSLEIDPNLWQAYLNMGGLYFFKKDYNKAADFMSRAIKIRPRDPNLYYNLGVIYVFLGDKMSAKQAFLKAAELNPEERLFQRALLDLETQ